MKIKYLIITLLFSGIIAFADDMDGDMNSPASPENIIVPAADITDVPETITPQRVENRQNLEERIKQLYSPRMYAPLHTYLASQVVLNFDGKKIKGSAASLISIINESKSFMVEYSDIATLADEFSDENIMVSNRSFDINRSAFLADFNSMLTDNVGYLPVVLELIDQELADNKTNILNALPLEVPIEDDIKFNCATGGGCTIYDYLNNPGLYLKLAAYDVDNFGEDAVNTYLVGHSVALNTALKAKNEKDLKLAYAYEAFAAHFLMDVFSSSRIRIPRKELFDWCFPDTEAVSVLTNSMTEQDSKDGIYLTSYSGATWIAYGSSYVFTKHNTENLKRASQALQHSADQVYLAYKKKADIPLMLTSIKQELPDVKKIINDPRNSPAMFKVANRMLQEYNPEIKKYKPLNCTAAKLRFTTEKIHKYTISSEKLN